jgi:hypothetical protein
MVAPPPAATSHDRAITPARRNSVFLRNQESFSASGAAGPDGIGTHGNHGMSGGGLFSMPITEERQDVLGEHLWCEDICDVLLALEDHDPCIGQR